MQLFVLHAITSCVIQLQHIHAQHNGHSESETEDFDPSKSIDHAAEYSAIIHGMHNHTFVALIDIMFTDGSKRTCTGAIVHDNVVITARHCFGKTHDKFIQPEITASFVVIGSKKMFETGYEQYLPIERIVSHPKYKGWTADIALVYTFAGMMSDKPGTIVPLAGEKISITNHSNLTLFSWGQCKTSDIQSEKEEHLDDKKRHTKYPLRAKYNPLSGSEDDLPSIINRIKYTKPSQKLKAEKTKNDKTKRHEEGNKKYSTKASRVTEGIYRSQTSADDYTDEDSLNEDYVSEISHKLVESAQKHHGSIFKNWRRNMGSEKNELSIENFKFVSMQICEEMMKKALPDKYKIKNPNEFICYSSEDHFVTDEDAGAPAVRHGHLVAVTVGGVKSDGEHVAVGIKISCFCNWIADNLPDGGAHLSCCDRCCNNDKPSPDEDDKDETHMRSAKKKKKRS